MENAKKKNGKLMKGILAGLLALIAISAAGATLTSCNKEEFQISGGGNPGPTVGNDF